MRKPSDLLRELNEVDEHRRIEAKTASELGRSIVETISAFSNTIDLGGGWLLMGVRRAAPGEPYRPVGIADVDKLQTDLASQCRSMFNEVIRPDIVEPERLDGHTLLAAFIPEAKDSRRPIYIESRGLPKGAYIRVGAADHRCTDADLEKLYRARSRVAFDGELLEGTSVSDVSPRAIQNYRRARREQDAEASELEYGDAKLLRALQVARPDATGKLCLTVAGVLLFGTDGVLRRHFPMVRADYIRIDGRQWMEESVNRFLSQDLYGPIFETVFSLEATIMDSLPKKFVLPEGSLHRVDVPPVPASVVREALVNALMHRDYSVSSPVQIIRYSNRIEFRNVGYSLKPEDQLGQPGSVPRNPAIANVLHQTRLAETKGSGIGNMRRTMEEAELTPPSFLSSREDNRFMTTLLLLHTLEPDTLRWLERFARLELTREHRQALVWLRETGEIRNENYRDINGVDTLTASGALRRLRDLGLLEPNGSGSGTYYTPTEYLLDAPDRTAERGPALGGEIIDPAAETLESRGEIIDPAAETLESRGEIIDPAAETLESPRNGTASRAPSTGSLFDGSAARSQKGDDDGGVLPTELTRRISALGNWSNYAEMREVLVALCEIRPHTAEALAERVSRSAPYLQQHHLTPLLKQGKLQKLPRRRGQARQRYTTP